MDNHAIRRTLTALILLAALLMMQATALAYDETHPESLSSSDLTASSAILIDGHTGRVLFSKDPDTRRYPASTTKVMTLMLALEHVPDLDEIVTIPSAVYDVPADSSAVGLIAGEKMPWRTLLYTFHICSGNDAAMAIAYLISGSDTAFVELMNEKAAELGCENTHFANPHGYHDANHYTTARDLAKIALEAMKNETFRQIVSTTNYTIEANNKRSEAVTKWTKNQFIARNDTKMQYKYFNGTGIKTGYTSKAGHTFVGSASKDGVDLISVVLLDTTDGKWIDSIRLMEYGFATYEAYDPSEMYNENPITVDVSNAQAGDPSGGNVTMRISSSTYTDPICATKSEITQIRNNFRDMIQVSYTRERVAPINEGEAMGTLTYTAPTGETYSYLLTAANSVAAMPQVEVTAVPISPEVVADDNNETMLWIIPLCVIMAVLILMIVLNNLNSRRRRRKPVRRTTGTSNNANYQAYYRRPNNNRQQ